MGLDINGSRFLLSEKKRGLSLGRLLTLGRQEVYMSTHDYGGLLKELNCKQTIPTYADDFFYGLEASTLEIMDASDYEGADVIHDLNNPVSPNLHATFDTVIDGGTLEHVFHFPNSIQTCMELVKPGGHLVLMTPWHNHSGHGFYQFSPELFYNILSPENGYLIERMLIVSDGCWYSVMNPKDINSRIEISTSDSVNLYILAKRLNSTKIFLKYPQQSDYNEAWKQGAYGDTGTKPSTTFKNKIVSKFPLLQNLQYKWRQIKSRRRLFPPRNQGLVKICKCHEIPF